MKRVKGNKLVLDIALQKVQLVSGEKETTDFLLTSSDVVKVRFVGNTTKDVVPEISISTIKVVDNGTLPCGSYGVEVLITTADGDNYRYYDSDLFTIVERTSDADIVGNAEFDDESSISLGASVYEAASGSTTTSGLTTAQVQALLTPYAKDADLARVAKSGSYTDLEDKPTIPSAYDDTEIKAQIASKQDASSAFDGDYNSLTNKPTIPTMPSDYLTSDDLQGYATTEALSGKVDKVSGKGLSSNDYTDEDKEKLASLENNNVDLSNYATKSDLDAKQNKLTDRILLRVNGQHDDTLTIYGGVYSSSFGNNIGGYNMYFNKSGMYINNKQVATQEWVNENCDTSSLEERVDALEAIDHTQYLTEHQSLAGYAKSADVAKDYQPKGTYLTEHQSLEGYAKTADLNTTDWDDASDKAHEHTNKSVLDGITSTKVSSWDKALPFENTYVSNANSWLTNGYTKTGTSTSNLPSGKNWGVLFFIAENATNGTGVQMWFGLSGEVYVRSITSKSPSSSWSQLATLDNLSSYLTTDSASQTYQVKGNYLTEHQTLKTINGQSLVGDGNISITSDSTTSYDDTEVRTLIGGKMDKEEVVSMTASTASISPNKFYKWGEVSSLVVTLATPTDTTHTNHYHFRFQAGSATTLGVPASVIWQGGKEPPCTNGNVYEVSIVDGCASFMEFTPYDD